MARDLIDYFVLDAVANDLEELDNILRLMNDEVYGWRSYHPALFTTADVIPALRRTVRDGLVRVAVVSATEPVLEELPERTWPSGSLEDAWFGLTPHGKIVHASWEPEPLPKDSPEEAT